LPDIAIRVEHLSKKYRLGVINNGTLFRDIQTWIALKRGKEDPHSQIGENKYTNTEDFFWALKDITLDIKQGDRVGIIGKNGAGKSTLLKILSRITSPTEGKIKLKGRITSLLEVGTGFHGELTGRENIYLNGAILGMKKRRIDQKIDEIIAFSEIEHHIDTPVKRYSSGMYVRLAFAIAAHLDSDILIADEVLAVGDAEFQKKALGKMQDLSTGQGRTVLFVSHNIGAVQSLCNVGILLEQGKIIGQADINDIIHTYTHQIIESRISCWEGVDGDDGLKLYKAEITQEDKNTAKLIVTYEIFEPYRDYTFSLFFYNEYGQCLSTFPISGFISVNEHKLMCNKGIHTFIFSFDTSIYAAGKYYTEFNFAIYNVRRIVSPDIKIFFEIQDRKFERHFSSNHFKNTIFQPNWTLQID
jgi:lipopolysaccharide transport system ATP-binding protein